MNELFVLNIEPESEVWNPESNVQPCPVCGVNKSSNCGYGEYDYFGDFDCTHENAGKLNWNCEGCPELAFHSCKSKDKVKQ